MGHKVSRRHLTPRCPTQTTFEMVLAIDAPQIRLLESLATKPTNTRLFDRNASEFRLIFCGCHMPRNAGGEKQPSASPFLPESFHRDRIVIINAFGHRFGDEKRKYPIYRVSNLQLDQRQTHGPCRSTQIHALDGVMQRMIVGDVTTDTPLGQLALIPSRWCCCFPVGL